MKQQQYLLICVKNQNSIFYCTIFLENKSLWDPLVPITSMIIQDPKTTLNFRYVYKDYLNNTVLNNVVLNNAVFQIVAIP